MGAPLVTLSLSDLPGVIREALRVALRDHGGDLLDLGRGGDVSFERGLVAVANDIAKALTLSAAGRGTYQPPAFTPGQVCTIASALDSAIAATRGVIRRNGEADVPAYVRLLAEQQELLETFDALLGDRQRQADRRMA